MGLSLWQAMPSDSSVSRVPSTSHCGVCKVDVTSYTSLKEHLLGMKHQQKAHRASLSCDGQQSFYLSAKGEDTLMHTCTYIHMHAQCSCIHADVHMHDPLILLPVSHILFCPMALYFVKLIMAYVRIWLHPYTYTIAMHTFRRAHAPPTMVTMMLYFVLSHDFAFRQAVNGLPANFLSELHPFSYNEEL